MLSLRIITPLQDVFSGEVNSVSSRNSAGDFDILPGHARFITLVNNQPIIARLPSGEQKKFDYPEAVIYCQDDKIAIFTDLSKVELLLPEPKPFI